MPACYVCRRRNASIRMPGGDTLSLWARSLDLTVCPPVTSRICVEHFRDSDITVTVTGSRRVKSGALPTRELHGREEVNSRGVHTYKGKEKKVNFSGAPWLMWLELGHICIK